MTNTPNYIAKAGFAGAPVTFKWTGPFDHVGPIEGTALHDSIESLTHCGAIALASVLQRWAVYRFQGMVDPHPYLAQADAVLAWTIDPAYARPQEVAEVEAPPAKSAMSVIAKLIGWSIKDSYRKFAATEPPSDLVHVAFLLKHVIPREKSKPFATWMKWALKRLSEVAARPTVLLDRDEFKTKKAYELANRPYFGDPLPLEILDPDFDYKPSDRQDLLDRFLQSLDWKVNPYLRTLTEMKKSGFKGTPYRLR
jgi:hypothetical protein